jgi:hypothetical protein
MEAKALILNGFENVSRELNRSLNGLTPDELKWKPKPEANSIGYILFHMSRSEDFFFNCANPGKPQVWESEKWYLKFKRDLKDGGGHYTPEQYRAFVVPELKDLLAYSEGVRKSELEFLNSLNTARLDSPVNMPAPPPRHTPDGKIIPPGKPPFEHVIGGVLFFSAVHLLGHAGEISYIRGLIRGMDK